MENVLDLNFKLDGKCACGCGRQTPLAPFTYKKRGWVKGQPTRFVRGHSSVSHGFPMAKEGHKWCCGCRHEKPKTEFHTGRYQPDKLASRCKSCASAGAAKIEPHKTREYRLKNKYGISSHEYNRLLNLQGNACAICRKPSLVKPLCVDHDHTTGKVRGLLCKPCNFLIGFSKENVQVMENAITYLKSHE